MLLLLQYMNSGGKHSKENKQNQLLREMFRVAQKEGREVGQQRLCSPNSLKVCRCRSPCSSKSPKGRGSAPPAGVLGLVENVGWSQTAKDGSTILVTWPRVLTVTPWGG